MAGASQNTISEDSGVSNLPSQESEAAPSARREPGWIGWLLPSVADVIFLALIGTVVFRPIGNGLLGDADTGWHIRNGEQILATQVLPRTDPFSYTKAGQPWFAWEWLYDVLFAWIHQIAGLNGVVLFTLMLVCTTFALLFRLLLRRGGNLVVAATLALMSAAASQIHLLARPHVFSWFFSLLWVEILYRFDEGKRKGLLWLPPIMLLWVNIHGGFLMGLMLICVFGGAILWRYLTSRLPEDGKKLKQLGLVFLACAAATMVAPYGYRLHAHVYQYLSNKFLMDTINEFASPNFHVSGPGYFEALILLTVAGCAVAWKRIRVVDLFLILFSLHAALFAARNIPPACILISQAIAPTLASAISPRQGSELRPKLVSVVLEALDGVSDAMLAMERQFRGHLLVTLIMAGCWAIALNGGFVNRRAKPVMTAHFDERDFPVQATEFLAKKGVTTELFSTDAWSGYLIYKQYPKLHLFIDDRHDFYGEAFVRQYVETMNGGPKWREPLDAYHVKWVLMPVDSSLVSLLRQSADWQVAYTDKVAVVFSRRVTAGTAR